MTFVNYFLRYFKQFQFMQKNISFSISTIPFMYWHSPRERFLGYSLIYCYYTRQCNSFCIHSSRTNIKQFALCFQGPKFFNSLNTEIANVGTLILFKSKLRTLLQGWFSSHSSLFIYLLLLLFFFYFSHAVFICLSTCFCCCFMCVCPFLFNLKYFVPKSRHKTDFSPL